mmetsp:Transcript_10265/g.31254  ORF Transcript_10265/g.31254 Transcript_10265/m.31254 type:complete len:227 (-) Transcript_10265:135-815(-)
MGAQKRVISVQTKQSGTPGITWSKTHNGWDVLWREAGKKRHKHFAVRKYTSPGKSTQEADAQAFHDARAFREGLVEQGKIKVCNSDRKSNIKGVCWHKKGYWQVQTCIGSKRSFSFFKPKDDTPEEIERARKLAVEHRRKQESEHYDIQVHEVPDPNQQRKIDSGVTGVTWHGGSEAWRVQIRLRGKKVCRWFRSKDSTPGEIEVARLAAVACRKDLEHQRLTFKA